MTSKGSTMKLTTNVALSFLAEVKKRFKDEKGKYEDFVEIMKSFMAQRLVWFSLLYAFSFPKFAMCHWIVSSHFISFLFYRIDIAIVIAKVKELFKGDRELIKGFNAFLPKEYVITLPSEDEAITLPSEDEATPAKRTVKFGEAMDFITKIKVKPQSGLILM